MDKKANVFVLGKKNNFKRLKKSNFFRFKVLKKEKLDLLVTELKNKNFDIVIHCLGGSHGLDTHSKLENVKNVWLLNAAIPIYLNEILLKKMKKKKFGRIVHISTAASKNLKGRAPYICSKSYLNTYIKKKSLDLCKFNIFLNGVLPGAIEAHKNNLKLFLKKKSNRKKFVNRTLRVNIVGTINSLIPIIEFMVSKKNDYMVGELIKIDGGEK